jgi:hypothetical protein
MTWPAERRSAPPVERNLMITRTPHAPDALSRRTMAQRRIRRTAPNRLFCSTNGCATYLVPDDDGRGATCPICGLRRRTRDAAGTPAQRTH